VERRRIGEGELVAAAVRQQAEAYEKVRDLLGGEKNPWEQLQSAYDGLQAEQPDSPTTESVETVLGSSRLPSIQRVRQLIEEAKNPETAGGRRRRVGRTTARCRRELRRELPNADVTDDVTAAVDADDRPTDERATELLGEAEKLLSRIRAVRDALDDVDEGSIVLIEERQQHEWSVLL